MTRRGSRAEGRSLGDAGTAVTPGTAGTPSYSTSGVPADTPVLFCGTCGGVYRDHQASRQGHKTAIGHWPTDPRKPAPAAAESAPDQHQEQE